MTITGASETSERVVRGGSWFNDADNLRASYRNRNHVWNRNNNLGFRPCVVLCVGEHALQNAEGRPCRKRPGQPGFIAGRPNRHCPAVPVSAPRSAHRPAGHPSGSR